MTLQEIIDDIHALNEDLEVYERKYGVLSELASTFPHHKHIPPNIKQNRVPASNMQFEEPNLPALIQEIKALIQQNQSTEET